jgi:RHS repeat-associated protein
VRFFTGYQSITVASMEYCLSGFNGQRPDPVSGHSHLGNGYRAYTPVLGRFITPDSWSPFGAGGINPYAYCAGDPINRADPSGHMSGLGIAGMVMGAFGILMAPITAGQSLTVMSCLTAGLEIVSGATAIAAGALEESSPSASSALGWISLATGMLSMGIGLAKMTGRAADGVAGLTGRLQRINGKIGIPMSGEFRNPRFLGMYDATMNIDRERPMSMMFDHSYNYNPRGPLDSRSIIVRLNNARPRRVVFHEWDDAAGGYIERQLNGSQLAERTFGNNISHYYLHFAGDNVDVNAFRPVSQGFVNQYQHRLRQLAPPGNELYVAQKDFMVTEDPVFRLLVSPPRLRDAQGGLTGPAAQAYLDDIATRFDGESYVLWDIWNSRTRADLR